jgi:Flp pilus assembly protein CpaB
VDVLVTFDVAPRSITKTVLQNVLVLGVGAESVVPSSPSSSGGQATPAEGSAPAQPAAEGGAQPAQPATPANQAKPMPSVTLAVTPDQAQALVLSAKKGSVYLALRPKSDTQMVALAVSSNASVLGAENVAPVPAPGYAAPGGTQVARAANQQTPGVPGTPGAPGAGAPGRPGIQVLRGTGSREVVTP